MLQRVGLGERDGHYPRQLSGGEQQRVALARASVTRPAVLFADEPTGNLDTATGASICQLLFDLNREFNTTLVLVTHDATLAARCERTLTMSAGRLVLSMRSALSCSACARSAREWRSGDLAVLFLALFVAVAALTGVGFLVDRIDRAMQLQASEVLAADLRLHFAGCDRRELRRRRRSAWAAQCADRPADLGGAARRGHAADQCACGQRRLSAARQRARVRSSLRHAAGSRRACRGRVSAGRIRGCWRRWARRWAMSSPSARRHCGSRAC